MCSGNSRVGLVIALWSRDSLTRGGVKSSVLLLKVSAFAAGMAPECTWSFFASLAFWPKAKSKEFVLFNIRNPCLCTLIVTPKNVMVQLPNLLASSCPGSRGETSKRGLDGWLGL